MQYLNTAPLVHGFMHGPLKGKYDLSFTIPSQCADDLRDGLADVAIIPAIEYQRIENLVMLPDLAIAAKRRVRSLLIISRKPIAGSRQHCAGPQLAQHPGTDANSVRRTLAHRAAIFRSISTARRRCLNTPMPPC